jgi:NAD(P)-dependent dehydrogenase (short-subunit alcohol dehydrogenase family)
MTLPSFSLEGKVAVITGGSRGIGRTLASAFAEAGAAVAICARNASELEQVAAEVRSRGGRCLAVPTDIGKSSDVDNLFAATVKEFGTVDILVNNAIEYSPGLFLDLQDEDWDRMMNTYLRGYFRCSQTAARVMAEQKKGNVVNFTSVGGVKAPPGYSLYGIAKAAIIMLTKAMAVELAQHNIRVNAIGPSLVRTEGSRPLWGDPAILELIVPTIPLGRIAEPEELVGVALFLASDASSYITGQTILVDGGSLT